jgi:ligand-binding SRPBCC domain-containing protein
MAAATFHHRYFIPAPASTVYNYLSDPKSYVGLSPLVTEVSTPETHQNGDGQTVIHYEAVETFRFLGFMRYPNRIQVDMILAQPNVRIINLVKSVPNVRVKFVFDFQPEGDGTWVQEEVTAHMPLPLKGFVVSQAKGVQQARSRILKDRIEALLTRAG